MEVVGGWTSGVSVTDDDDVGGGISPALTARLRFLLFSRFCCVKPLERREADVNVCSHRFPPLMSAHTFLTFEILDVIELHSGQRSKPWFFHQSLSITHNHPRARPTDIHCCSSMQTLSSCCALAGQKNILNPASHIKKKRSLIQMTLCRTT